MDGLVLHSNQLLRCAGLGSKKLAEMQDEYDSIRLQLREYTEYADKFNRYFSADGWLAHDSQDFRVLKQAVEEYETEGKDEATKVLLDYYGPTQVAERLVFFDGVPELRIRRKFIDHALADYKAQRHYSAIPLLLMVMDGAANEAVGRGLHADSIDLDVWDSLTAVDGAIDSMKNIFQKGRRKTCTDPITLPYRNGILHGMDLEYDNPVVTAKCWCFLFVVRDWIASKKSESKRREDFNEETRIPSFLEIMDLLNQTDRLRQAVETWERRKITPAYIGSLNCSLTAEDGLPESTVMTCLAVWSKKNYGHMAELFWSKVAENPKKFAGELRELYGGVNVTGYSILRIVDEASAITEIDIRVAESDTEARTCKFRLIYEDENGDALPRNLEEGNWRIVWINMTEGLDKGTN